MDIKTFNYNVNHVKYQWNQFKKEELIFPLNISLSTQYLNQKMINIDFSQDLNSFNFLPDKLYGLCLLNLDQMFSYFHTSNIKNQLIFFFLRINTFFNGFSEKLNEKTLLLNLNNICKDYIFLELLLPPNIGDINFKNPLYILNKNFFFLIKRYIYARLNQYKILPEHLAMVDFKHINHILFLEYENFYFSNWNLKRNRFINDYRIFRKKIQEKLPIYHLKPINKF